MNSVAEIRQHIRSIEDTSKITRAMYLISSSKMKKAMRMHDENMRFFNQVRSDIRFIYDNTSLAVENRYYREHGNHAAYIVIAGDKGLCGGYNQEVCKHALETISDSRHQRRALLTIGHMASDFFTRQHMFPDGHYTHVIQDPSLQNARTIMQEMRNFFYRKTFDEVYVIYTAMEKIGVLQPRTMRLLPVLEADFADAAILHKPTAKLTYHPSQREVLENIIPHYLVGQFYSALVQSYASEHYSRMTAMDAATRNADEMLARLRLELNHARQTQITQEITEIISGAGALDGGDEESGE